jgi:hypothetical protein
MLRAAPQSVRCAAPVPGRRGAGGAGVGARRAGRAAPPRAAASPDAHRTATTTPRPSSAAHAPPLSTTEAHEAARAAVDALLDASCSAGTRHARSSNGDAVSLSFDAAVARAAALGAAAGLDRVPRGWDGGVYTATSLYDPRLSAALADAEPLLADYDTDAQPLSLRALAHSLSFAALAAPPGAHPGGGGARVTLRANDGSYAARTAFVAGNGGDALLMGTSVVSGAFTTEQGGAALCVALTRVTLQLPPPRPRSRDGNGGGNGNGSGNGRAAARVASPEVLARPLPRGARLCLRVLLATPCGDAIVARCATGALTVLRRVPPPAPMPSPSPMPPPSAVASAPPPAAFLPGCASRWYALADGTSTKLHVLQSLARHNATQQHRKTGASDGHNGGGGRGGVIAAAYVRVPDVVTQRGRASRHVGDAARFRTAIAFGCADDADDDDDAHDALLTLLRSRRVSVQRWEALRAEVCARSKGAGAGDALMGTIEASAVPIANENGHDPSFCAETERVTALLVAKRAAEAPSPPYTLARAPGGASACVACGARIGRGELRLGTLMPAIDLRPHTTYAWRHLGCVTPRVRANVRKACGGGGSAADVPGYDAVVKTDAERDAARDALF